MAFLSSGGLNASEVEDKGKTSYEDVRGSLHLGADKQWIVAGHYNRYKGLFVENTQDLTPGAATKIQRPDIEVFNSGASLMYIFSAQRYSAAAAYAQSDIQTESGGSFLAMVSVDSNYFKGESELIPLVVRPAFGEQQNLKEARFVTGSVLGGYAHTFVWNGFFINGTVLLGTGSQRQSYTYDDQHKTGQSQAFRQVISGALGYNGEQFFSGATLSFNRSDYDVGSVKISPNLNSAKVYLGIRF